ncbi:hypothetical protein QWY79_03620 [Halomonas sabkhae]|uniref:hypothetical protein n=1 Tax=Halomonas sabkhae TaxID=626223 RepID=UPI0025B3BBEE|nr:hypothetical protein [Halomonas sabkhae]MDN3524351.1 hypothetical protein [Halomonas sabkhae]
MATQKTTARKAPSKAGSQKAPADAEEIPAVFVRTRRGIKSRRRAGHRFTREGFGIALSALSEAQVAQLRDDPALEVKDCTLPAEADSESEA